MSSVITSSTWIAHAWPSGARAVSAGRLAASVETPLVIEEDGERTIRDRRSLVDRQAVRALVTPLTTRVDAETMAQWPRLALIANCAAGYDNIDVEAAAARGVQVAHTPGVLTDATADLAFLLLLAAARRLPEADALARGGAWQGFAMDLLLGAPVAGRTLGIIGMGRIGRAMAARARGFSMPVIYVGGADASSQRVTLAELWQRADYISLHCRLTEDTRQIVNAASLAQCKPGVIIINTARGACIDEAALIDALSRGQVAAAGLDVFAHEPSIPAPLRQHPRVVLAPHIGSATTNVRMEMLEMSARSVAAALAGEPVPYLLPEMVVTMPPPTLVERRP